jgi:GNAT superfamily N-acetyltransferase
VLSAVGIRDASHDEVETCFSVQRRSAVVGYAHIFPQDRYPFPDDVVRREWAERMTTADWVGLAERGGEAVGTISVVGNRIESLFVVPEEWGSGVATQLLAAGLDRIRAAGHGAAALDVMADNARARRFYEREGWTPDGRVSTSPFPPYPEIVGYRRQL